jgi:hypothetical protein
MNVSAAYIGSHTVALLYPRNINQPVPGTAAFTSFLHPGLSTILLQENGGSQSFNSLQLAAAKNAGKNLTFSGGFTWAKDLTDQQDQDTFVGQTIQNAYDRRSERGNNRFTSRLRTYVDVVYSLPIGRGQYFLNHTPRMADAILGGWRFSAIGTLQTGQYYTPSFSGIDPSNTNNPGGRPDVVPGVSWQPSGGATISNSVNLAAFSIPGCTGSDPLCANTPRVDVGRFGNAGVNILRGPGVRTFDLALFKEFHVGERVVIQLEAQGSNALNHPNFNYATANISSPATGAAMTALNGQVPAARTIYLDMRVRF